MAQLQLENICYRYPSSDRDVLSHISCTFSGGKLNAVVGPSGSGKSTLLSILAGLDKPDEGTIRIDGVDYAQLDLDQCRREQIAMVFQSFQLFPLLTVLENVCFPMELCGASKPEAAGHARKLLEAVGIPSEKHKRFPSHLSGGEQQRVAIARALSAGAKILLADEPTGNLDRNNTQKIMQILGTLARKEGYCVIVVTHDPEVAALSDCVWRMADGVLTLEK